MEEKEVTVLEGTIVYKVDDIGSKSEGVKPFLYINKSSWVKLYREGDNPFENKGFDEYDGMAVVVKGNTGKNGVFVVDDIKKK